MCDSNQEIEFKTRGEQMANDLVVGDNIVVVCQSSTNESFQLFLCDKMVHIVKESFIDGWG